MRLFAASLATETNTFSPIPTSRANFEASAYFPAGQHPDRPTHTTAPLYVARQRAKRDGFTLIEGSCFWAEPSGTCAMADYEEMRDEILGQLKAALPVDGVLLGLHGAMVAHGYDDCEGDILEHVRALVGSQVPIGVELDPHCHLTEKRVRLANAIILYKEYPHIDFVERAEELVTIIVRTIRGEIRPVMSLYDCRMIELVPTTREPGRSFVDRMSALEGKENVLSVSLAHGFQQGDVPEIGSRVLVITDDAKAAGDALATRLGEEFRALKGQFAPPVVPLDQALDQALASTGNRPSVIADSTDNAGGGAASDNTNIIHRLRERGIRDVAIGPVWDPVAVGFCLTAGVGSTIPLRFGGKAAATSGTPVRWRSDRAWLRPQRHAELRHGQGADRRCRGYPHRRHRRGAALASHPGARARDIHQRRYRPDAEAHRQRQVDQSFPRRLRADRQRGDLYRRRRPLASRRAQISLSQDRKAALAA
jgi:microcystin degradation protein MlrC